MKKDLSEIIRRHLNSDFVAGQDLDVILSDSAWNVCQNVLNNKGALRQGLKKKNDKSEGELWTFLQDPSSIYHYNLKNFVRSYDLDTREYVTRYELGTGE